MQKYQTAGAAAMALVLRGRIIVARSRTPARIDEALAQFRKAQEFYKGTDTVPIARFYEADTYRMVGRNREALDGFGRVATDYPRSPWAAKSRLGAALSFVALGDPFSAIEELQRVRARFPGTEHAATALQWNTALYRLHVGTPQQAGFSAAGRVLPAAPGKLRDVEAIVVTPKGELAVVSDNVAMMLSATGAAGRSFAQAARGLLIDGAGRLMAVQKGALAYDQAVLPLSIPKTDGTLKQLDDVTAAVAWATGEYLVSDKSSRSILKFSLDGKPQGVLASGVTHRMAVNLLDHRRRARYGCENDPAPGSQGQADSHHRSDEGVRAGPAGRRGLRRARVSVRPRSRVRRAGVRTGRNARLSADRAGEAAWRLQGRGRLCARQRRSPLCL